MGKIAAFAYGIISYLIFFSTFSYAIGFIGDFLVPRSIDSLPVQDPFGKGLLINLGLLGLFAVQHSLMARKSFKKMWTRIVPEPIERSTYVLFSSLAIALLLWQWRPMGGTIWNIEESTIRIALHLLCASGWFLLFMATFLINHFELFGVQQVWHYLRGRAKKSDSFVTPGPYRLIRHPLYLGWCIAVWSTPTMTVAHLLFAVATTGYIIVGIQFEERDLVATFGESYREYKRRVPMLIPGFRRSAPPQPQENV